MGESKNSLHPGDIFKIPLFLPSFQEWRNLEEFIDYRKYKFRDNDIYAFGRLVELRPGNMNLVEIFSYVGEIPQSPEIIIRSGRLFEPVMMVGAFSRGRWRFLFDSTQYDKWTDSNYGDISFLMGMGTELWKGGEQIGITYQQGIELEKAGVSYMVVHGSVDLEVEIRSLLAARGVELNYGQTVERRRDEYPRPRDLDKKLKEAISPFCWQSNRGSYSLCLDAGLLNGDSFEKNNMLGNGYDWGKVASAFIEVHLPHLQGKFSFDCEADMFSMHSNTKKTLKEFALAFHKFVLDASAFDGLLSRL